MVEQSSQESVRYKVGGERSTLLMPVVEGNTLPSNDVANFLTGRLSLLPEWKSPLPKSRLS
jgi:hypothetical protein